MFILCSNINNANFDETLLLAILSKFKLTSLRIWDGNKDENIFMLLLQIPSIQDSLEHFYIRFIDISKCTSVIDMLFEFNRIKKIEIKWGYSKDDKLGELYREIKQSERKMRKKHSEIEIDIKY